jgi:hypothetical protein
MRMSMQCFALLIFLTGTSRATVICGKVLPLKPVRCVCGKLVSEILGPLSGAVVRVSQNGVESTAVSTDADGKFLFRDLTPGRYELTAVFEAFRPFRSQIVVTKPASKCRRKLVIMMVPPYPDNCGSYVTKR